MLADAGIDVLAREGARGLTHRAVDRAASVPQGTSSNYFPRRDLLVAALVERIGERLAPDADVLARLGAQAPDRALFAEYIRDIVTRLSTRRDVTIALFELRLEATRRPEIATVLADWQRRAFLADVEFNSATGLPGGAFEVALFHYAIDGLMFDRLTTSIDPETDVDRVVDALVAGLLERR